MVLVHLGHRRFPGIRIVFSEVLLAAICIDGELCVANPRSLGASLECRQCVAADTAARRGDRLDRRR